MAKALKNKDLKLYPVLKLLERADKNLERLIKACKNAWLAIPNLSVFNCTGSHSQLRKWLRIVVRYGVSGNFCLRTVLN